jgi:putative transposase
VAERRQAVVDRQPTGTVSMAWDNAATHFDAAGEAVVRAAAGRSLPTASPWRHPRELRWRQFRRAVTHGELFTSLDALLQAARAFFDRDHQGPHRVRSIIGAHAA